MIRRRASHFFVSRVGLRHVHATPATMFAKEASWNQKGGKKKGATVGISDDLRKQMLKSLSARQDNSAIEKELGETLRVLGNVYNRECQKRNGAWISSLNVKIALKKSALAALPEEMRKEAEDAEVQIPPISRPVATWTPPIPQFSRMPGAAEKLRKAAEGIVEDDVAHDDVDEPRKKKKKKESKKVKKKRLRMMKKKR